MTRIKVLKHVYIYTSIRCTCTSVTGGNFAEHKIMLKLTSKTHRKHLSMGCMHCLCIHYCASVTDMSPMIIYPPVKTYH